MRSKKHVIFIILAGTMWGFMGFFVRRLADMGLTSLDMSEVRCLLTAVLLTAFLAVTDRKKLKIRLGDAWCFIGTGILSIIFFNYCYFRTIQATDLATAAVLLYTSPIFVTALSALFFRERLTALKIAAALMVVAGCALVSGIAGAGSLTPLGLLTGVGAGVGYALYSIFSRCALVRGYSPITITTYTFIFAAAGGLPLCNPGRIISAAASAGNIGFMLLFALMTTVLPYLLYTLGLEGVESSRAAVMVAVEPVVATLAGIFIYKETLSAVQIVGIALVLFAIALPAITEKRERPKSTTPPA